MPARPARARGCARDSFGRPPRRLARQAQCAAQAPSPSDDEARDSASQTPQISPPSKHSGRAAATPAASAGPGFGLDLARRRRAGSSRLQCLADALFEEGEYMRVEKVVILAGGLGSRL